MTLEQRAARHYPNSPAYQQAWVRIVQILGPKWLLAQQQNRKETS